MLTAWRLISNEEPYLTPGFMSILERAIACLTLLDYSQFLHLIKMDTFSSYIDVLSRNLWSYFSSSPISLGKNGSLKQSALTLSLGSDAIAARFKPCMPEKLADKQ